MTNDLQEIHRILVKHNHPGQAEVVARLLVLYSQDLGQFSQLLQSISMWGGSGAVWEVGPTGEDTRRFREAFIRLSDWMESNGLGMERSRFIASVFLYWNDLNI